MSLRTLALIAASALVIGGCDRRDMPENQTDGEPTAQGVDPSTSAAADDATTTNDPANTDPNAPGAITAGDGTALGLLGAVNEHEIAAAQQAKAKGVTGAVLDYANRMEKEHGENLAQTKTLGALGDDAEVQAQKAKGKAELDALAKLDGQAYSDAYVDAMIKGHTEVLALIDTRLMTLAGRADVTDHLTATRGHVAMHLDAAKALKK